mgnify:CR=1 FL=1
MAHMLEMKEDGTAYHVYVGETPWHNLGTRVPADLTPEQMLDAAGLNWSVEKIPAYANVGGKNLKIGQSALVRDRDNKILDVVSDDWNPVQNAEAFDFFNEFVAAGDMEMHTAGSLKDGQIVEALRDTLERNGAHGLFSMRGWKRVMASTRAAVIAISSVEAALTSGVTLKRTME